MLTLSELRSRLRPAPTHDDEIDPVADLPGVYAPRYRSRLGARYGVVRRWGPGKRSALAALRQSKMDLPASFIAALAGEMAAMTRSLHGSWTGCVVPVACGHSRRRDGLSFRLGVAVAQCLGAEFVEAFAFRPVSGSSHPGPQHRPGAHRRPRLWRTVTASGVTRRFQPS